MKKFLFSVVVAPALAAVSFAATAQNAIYRCGNEYLNDAAVAVARGCQMIEGGNVTVVPGTRVNSVEKAEASPAVANAPARSVGRSAVVNTRPSTDAAAQRARDSDARSILLAELMTAQARLAEQQQAYNNGVPEKRATDTQHPQRYQERVNELKDGIQRYTGDIAGLKREIARLPAIIAMPR
ncbi:MAG: hypothetical protein ACJAR7_000840 [Polaromonas sp.]|jgi:hypothetical protein